MRHIFGGLLWVLLAPSLVCCQTCTYNNTVLTGSNFEFAGVLDNAIFSCDNTVYLFKQQGAMYSLPELRVVANTTVTFNITFVLADGVVAAGFGLTLFNSSVTVSSGDALGLTPTADSVAAGACRAFPEAGMVNNSFAHNYTRLQYTAQPCVLTWQVPLANTNYNYSYFVHVSTYSTPARRIYIVNSTDVPSSSSSSSSGAFGASSSSSSPPAPISSSSVSSSSIGMGTGSSGLGPSSFSGTGTGSSSTLSTVSGTGSSSSLFSSSLGTSSSSSSSSTPNGAGVNGASALAMVVAVVWTLVSA